MVDTNFLQTILTHSQKLIYDCVRTQKKTTNRGNMKCFFLVFFSFFLLAPLLPRKTRFFISNVSSSSSSSSSTLDKIRKSTILALCHPNMINYTSHRIYIPSYQVGYSSYTRFVNMLHKIHPRILFHSVYIFNIIYYK